MKDKHDNKTGDMFIEENPHWLSEDELEDLHVDLKETFEFFESLSEKELNPYLFGEWKQEEEQ